MVKMNKRQILKNELRMWQEAYPKCKKVLEKFAKKMEFELGLCWHGTLEEDLIDCFKERDIEVIGIRVTKNATEYIIIVKR